MSTGQFEVLIVGGGCAGLSAAIGLAKTGISVAVVEAAIYPGAENWSGCVYFCENLVEPELLGPEGLQQLAWERRLVRRGAWVGNGQSLFGISYENAACFRHCYTVLRPIFDHHLAQIAMQHGVVLLNQTTAESLIREGQRVIGITTQRGPLYGRLVFLAEGDASHLVTKEGYERIPHDQKHPKYLHGIKQVLELPPELIERNFGLKPGEGAACEVILRNAKLHGKSLHLNMGGFIYTNHASLSMGLVLPAEHLHEHFAGDPHLLLEWFENLPDLQPWFRDGVRSVFGAKLIRGGGTREFPQMVDDGLAIGGAATGLGVDFPYPNYTGPATRMGLELVRAVHKIRSQKGTYSAAELQQHYLRPLKATRYWQDAAFLRDWPGYVERTHFFFDRQVDLLLGSAQLLAQKGQEESARFNHVTDLLKQEWLSKEAQASIQHDLHHLEKALPIKRVFKRPPLPLMLVESWLHFVGQLTGLKKPAPDVGQIRWHYSVRGEPMLEHGFPSIIQQTMEQMQPSLARAAYELYANDNTPLPQKVNRALQSLRLHLPWAALLRLSWRLLPQVWRLFKKSPALAHRIDLEQLAPQPDLTPWLAPAQQKWEDRLGRLGYLSDRRSHIHVYWPQQLNNKNNITEAGLWHVCPAHVYEARTNSLGQLQIVVNHENCIKCETCWRTSDLVDWGRDGLHRFIYAVQSPVTIKLLATQDAPELRKPLSPEQTDPWLDVRANSTKPPREILSHIHSLERQLDNFISALGAEPRTMDAARSQFLSKLAAWIDAQAKRLRIDLEQHLPNRLPEHKATTQPSHERDLFADMTQRIGHIQQYIEQKRFAWAASACRHIQQHHLQGLKALLGCPLAVDRLNDNAAWDLPLQPMLQADTQRSSANRAIQPWRQRIEELWGPYLWRELDQGHKLTPPQNEVLADALAYVPELESTQLDQTLHPAARKEILAELGRRDPSIGYRFAHHLWVRDLLQLFGSDMQRHAWRQLTLQKQWSAYVNLDNGSIQSDGCRGSATMLPLVDAYLIRIHDRLFWVTAKELGSQLQPVIGLGLRGTPLCQIDLNDFPLPNDAVKLEPNKVSTAYEVISQTDLIAIALGMADQLTLRCTQHAANRVQFPGMFHDERSRDTIGKFGAVKKMLAEMGAHRIVIETLCYNLSPQDFQPDTVKRVTLAKAATAQLLGTSPGSLSYNAGQIFGGTGYSEDDILSKYYRDASAWRFLAVDSHQAMHLHGQQLAHAACHERESAWMEEIQATNVLQGEAVTLLQQIEDLRQPLNKISSAIAEARGWVDAFLFASKSLLLRLFAQLASGFDSELTWSMWEVWHTFLQRWLARYWEMIQPSPMSTRSLEVQVNGFQSIDDYRQFLAQPIKALVQPSGKPNVSDPATKKALAYQTGDFLVGPIQLTLPRYTPEMIETDKTLAATDSQFHDLVIQQFGSLRKEMLFERYIEANHLPDNADLDYCRQHGFFRMPIPSSLGGEGKLKAEYYSLVMQTNQFADATMSLLIQANTSIGTSPILFARDKDLPKAIKECKPFAHDEELHAKVGLLLDAMAQRVHVQDVAGAQATLKELQPLLDSAMKSSALKPCLQPLIDIWKSVTRAVPLGDLKKASKAKDLPDAWQKSVALAKDLVSELDLRLQACDLGLRWIASGQISAFALTEPSAGSDTARVATRAKLVSVPVTKDDDGVLSFQLPDGGGRRVLLDASRLEFRPDGAFYRYQENAEPARIMFDEYDYETDDPNRFRYYQHGQRKVPFTDIAYLRQRDGQTWYDYWEMTGAKMWITNGRMSGIMSLYAKTSQGVTGFIVDRHAEGFIVGKDEAKMGQNGSPTNEIALQAVRVPKENVLGLEGRGQVNALETLNVGRAGLAMSSVSQMRTLIEMGQNHCQQPAANSKPLSHHLAIVREETWIAESLAYMVIGQFEHPSTQAVRMESAIAKMLVSELLHSSIEHTEVLFGLASQTRQHLVEKRKRDARIINIYEGTNEVQRFLLVKELVGDVLPRWQQEPIALNSDPISQQLLDLHQRFREQLQAAAQLFGQGLWQNPNLQPTVFWLAEASAWLLAAQAVAGRLFWLKGCKAKLKQPSCTETGQLALARCLNEVRWRLQWFAEEWQRIEACQYAATIRTADLMFDRLQHASHYGVTWSSVIEKPLHVLVVLEPNVAAVPQPAVHDGQLLESYWSLSEADGAALEAALRLRDQAPKEVHITAAMVGGRCLLSLMREIAARGVETLLVQAPRDGISVTAAAEALTQVMRERSWDLIIGPSSAKDQADGLLVPLMTCSLKLPYAGSTTQLAVRHLQESSELLLLQSNDQTRQRNLPAAVTLEPGLALRSYSTQGYLKGLANPCQIKPWPLEVLPQTLTWKSIKPAGTLPSDALAPSRLEPCAAADWLLQSLGVKGERNAPAEPLAVSFSDTSGPCRIDHAAALAIIACDADGRLSHAALACSRAAQRQANSAACLLLTPANTEAQEKATQTLLSLGLSHIHIVQHPLLTESEVLRSQVLQAAWPNFKQEPEFIVAERWADLALATIRRTQSSQPNFEPRLKRLALGKDFIGAESSRHAAKLLARQTWSKPSFKKPLWITVTDDVELEGDPAAMVETASPPVVFRWSPNLDRLFGQQDMVRLLGELKSATGTIRLSEAEYIIDVGYGVANRDGYEAVIEPLEKALKQIGVKQVQIGGSRKVTEELNILPIDRQIGQSGVSVNPKILLAIGISGAPQHLQYIGPRAHILCFNKDPEAPLMTLNQRQPKPIIYPIVGDLFQTVPAFVHALQQDGNSTAQTEPSRTDGST